MDMPDKVTAADGELPYQASSPSEVVQSIREARGQA